MKTRTKTLLLILIGGLLLLLSSPAPVPASSAYRERLREHNGDLSNERVRLPLDGDTCGTRFVETATKWKGAGAPLKFRAGGAAAPVASGPVEIPVYFHIIQDDSGNGDVPEYRLDEQIRVLNASFGGLTGGATTAFTFRKAGVTRNIRNTFWYQMTLGSTVERNAKTALRRGGAEALNFYTIGNHNQPGASNPYAWAYFAESYSSNPVLDGIVSPNRMAAGGDYPGFGEGDIGVHEAGHWLGLYHTYTGGCSGTDYVDDTPAHAEQSPGDGIVGTCPSALLDTCPSSPGNDPIHNFMQSTSDACKSQFTPKQAERMLAQYNAHRRPAAASPTASIEWVLPSEYSWGPPKTMTVYGRAQNGAGGVQVVWRDASVGGSWMAVPSLATPNPVDNSWSSTLEPANRCHNYEVYANYSGIQSPIFYYNGVSSGYCGESVNITWIQPQHTAGFGPPGSLIVAGNASGAPAGAQVRIQYRNLTVRTGWVYHPYAPLPDSNGTWLMDIPNVNFSHVYQVLATYDLVTDNCTYWGNNSISWCQ